MKTESKVAVDLRATAERIRQSVNRSGINHRRPEVGGHPDATGRSRPQVGRVFDPSGQVGDLAYFGPSALGYSIVAGSDRTICLTAAVI